MKVLVSGAAGFIGFHLCRKLIAHSDIEIVGIDNLNDYYDLNLKKLRLEELAKNNAQNQFNFIEADLCDSKKILNIFRDGRFDVVINLAAQAGVRYSLKNPQAYIDSNLYGFVNILECCRQHEIKHFLFASSSSVYGMNVKQPFSVKDCTDYPISLYAATKKSNELIAHSYSHLYNIPVTGLRFFTVYGPYGRPDMAYFKFTEKILNEVPIDIYNHGRMERDFTYIDDVIAALIKLIHVIPKPNEDIHSSATPKYKIYNIGNNSPVSLTDFVLAIEKACNKKAIKNYLPIQPGDVTKTFADIAELNADIDFIPSTSLDYGMKQFVDWYKSYSKNNVRNLSNKKS